MYLTEQEQEVWQYLWYCKIDCGRCASYNQIKSRFSNVDSILLNLHKKRYIYLFPNEPNKYLVFETRPVKNKPVAHVPILGKWKYLYYDTFKRAEIVWQEKNTLKLDTMYRCDFAIINERSKIFKPCLLLFKIPDEVEECSGKWCIVNVDDIYWLFGFLQIRERYRRTSVYIDGKEYVNEDVSVVARYHGFVPNR